jgi:aerobic carbon-monoxide dehydrogenase large subunit
MALRLIKQRAEHFPGLRRNSPRQGLRDACPRRALYGGITEQGATRRDLAGGEGMGQFGIGQPVRRKEDTRLLTGRGQFTDDLNFEGQAWAAFVRSPHANAKILGVDTAGALEMPGVIAVYTGRTWPRRALASSSTTRATRIATATRCTRPSARSCRRRRRASLAKCSPWWSRKPSQAREAAEAVIFDFEPLPAVVGTAKAVDPSIAEGVARVRQQRRRPLGVRRQATSSKLAAAAHRVSVDLVNNRLAVSPMEPRVAAAVWDASEESFTVYTPSQGGRRLQVALAENLLKLPGDKVRIISKDTGGGFGIRSKMYPETAMVAFAAMKLNRPVKWRGDRSETFVSDYHGRDQVNHAEMGLDKDGKIVALKVATLVNVGAYLSENGVRLPMEGGGRIIPCAYHVPTSTSP